MASISVAAVAQRQGRNAARPFFDDAREAPVAMFTALQSWTAVLLEGVDRPVALFYGNANPHAGDLTPEQMAQVAKATALIHSGGHMDEWVIPIFQENRTKDAPIIAAFSPDDFQGHDHDAHLWLDVEHARKGIRHIADELKKVYPDKAARIEENTARYDARLAQLSKEITDILSPWNGSEVLLEHPGCEPFLQRYGIKIAGYVTRQHGREVTPVEFARFRKTVEGLEHPVMLRSPGQLPVPVQRMTRDLPIRFAMFDVLESGDPSPEFYIHQMKQNAINLALALQTSKSIPPAFTPTEKTGDDASVVMEYFEEEPEEIEE